MSARPHAALLPSGARAAAVGRSLAIVAIFAAIGPPIGACVVWIVFPFFEPLARHAVFTTAPAELFGLFLMSLMLSYKSGIALALLAGIAVAIFRQVNGRTSWETPLVAAIIANVAGILFQDARGTTFTIAEYLFGYLPPSMIAAVACWLLARKAGLT